MIDEDPELEPQVADFDEDDGVSVERVEFYVPNPNAVAIAADHVNHWLDDRSIQELIGTHTVRHLRVLATHASQSLLAMRDPK